MEHRHAHHHRRQRRAEFVAENSQKMILGLIRPLGGCLGLFGGILRRFQFFLCPFPISDVLGGAMHGNHLIVRDNRLAGNPDIDAPAVLPNE